METILIWLWIHTILIFVMRSLLKKYSKHQNKWWYLIIVSLSVIIIPIKMWKNF